MKTTTSFTPDEMLAVLAQHERMIWSVARRFHTTNQSLDLNELHAEAETAFKIAAMKFDPSRGWTFGTFAYRVAWNSLLVYCRVELARGMHVPTNHEFYYAPAPVNVLEEWQHPAVEEEDEQSGPLSTTRFTDDFWKLIARDLTPRQQEAVLGCYRDGKRQVDVANETGVCKTAIGMRIQAAMKKLRRREDLKELVGEGRKAA